MSDTTKLTDQQIDYIANEMESLVPGTTLEDIANLPSNNGVDETPEENKEVGEIKTAMVSIDPNTGEHKVLSTQETDELDDDESIDEMFDRIESGELKFETEPITESELSDYIHHAEENQSLLIKLGYNTEYSPETIKELLEVVNRRINKEEFNVYKALPEEIQKTINDFIFHEHFMVNSNEGKQFRNTIAESLIDEFIDNISTNKAINDFNKEIESIFEKGTQEIASAVVGYTAERNKKYREYAEGLEDQEKKEKLLAVLDQIDEAYNLMTLKEFAKKCKIKKFELEKPQKIYTNFLTKYQNNTYNIYDISMTKPILKRHIPDASEKDVDAFLICFCKQCMNMKPDVVTEHAYMYYVIFNIVLIDVNRSEETRSVTDIFIQNIADVIKNLRERNNNYE